MPFLQSENRVRISFIIVSLAFVTGVLLSWKVWGVDRFFPTLPIVDFIPKTSIFIGELLIYLLVVLILISSVFPKKWIVWPMFLLLTFILLQDQMRWQPWVYLYFFFLLPLLIVRKNQNGNYISYLQILLIGVYLYSGVYKFSGDFNVVTFERILYFLFGVEDEATRQSLNYLGYIIPTLEVLVAILLVFKKTRNFAVFGAILSHLTILFYLYLSGHNYVVFPWNIAMIALVFVLFFKAENHIELIKLKGFKLKFITVLGAILFLVMPATSSFGGWDRYPSFKLYSGTNGIYMIAIDQDQLKKIDYRLHDYFWDVQRFPGKFWIYVNWWALEELNVPFYPEERTFKQVGRTFCDGEIPNSKIDFYVMWEDFDSGPYEKFSCSDLR